MAKNPKINRPIQQPVQNAPAEPTRIPNFELLDEETKERLRAEARVKIDAREIAAAEQAFMQAELDRLDRERHPEAVEEMVTVDLDGLALYADRIVLDGRVYMFGRTYTVRKSVAAVFQEVMARSRRHEAEIKSGDNYTTFYNKLRAGDWASKQPGVGKQLSASTGARTGF